MKVTTWQGTEAQARSGQSGVSGASFRSPEERRPLLLPLLPHPLRPQLSQDLLAQVRVAFPPPPAQTQKKEQRLLQLRGQIDSAKARAERLERSVTHHRSQLATCVANRDQTLSEVKKLEDEYRLLTDGKLSPNASPMASAHVSPEHSECDSEVENAMEMEEIPPVSSTPPLLSGETASCSASLDVGPPAGEHVLPDSNRLRRSLPPECGLQSSQPQLLQQISNCSGVNARLSWATAPSKSIGHRTRRSRTRRCPELRQRS